MSLDIGFTGTQKGLTLQQTSALSSLLHTLASDNGFTASPDTTFRHGDCIGADEVAHTLAYQLGFRIVVHPPSDARKRAWCSTKYGHPSVVLLDARPYIERNHMIVDACQVLVACPDSLEPRRRSGTWATVRYAEKQCKRIYLVYPQGVAHGMVDL